MPPHVIEIDRDLSREQAAQNDQDRFGQLIEEFVTAPPDDPSDQDEGALDETARRGPTLSRVLTEWLVVMVGAVVVALILRVFVLQAFWIPSESMEHTLDVDDRVLVNKLSYVVGDVSRGDIVVFRRPDDQPAEIRELIKRVIGVAGDVVEGRDNQVFLNGHAVAEPYRGSDDGPAIASPSNGPAIASPSNDFGPVEVGAGQVFLMGDNRSESWDSRSFGPVSTDRIVGRAFVLFWPLGRADLL